MNRIEARTARTRFVREPHLIIEVDGTPLDVLVHDEGLVPALLGWCYSDADNALAWERVLPGADAVSMCPLLICPDDLDFVCTVIVAEVLACDDVVHWRRLGYDRSPLGAPVGTVVRWEPRWGSYAFSRRDYEQFLQAFRRPAA